MQVKRRAYQSRNWKVYTPERIISLFWKLTHERQKSFINVLDMGAGDCKFSVIGNYQKYVGVEIDKKIKPKKLINKVEFINGCVFKHKPEKYSACIGNPPYLRHNDISNNWKKNIKRKFQKNIGLNIDGRSNLYVYFIALGLLKTNDAGIVSLLIPYEWTHIPSAKPIREYITMNNWSVFIYRFTYPIFENVLTTACISIIDKSNLNGNWKYFNVDKNNKISEVRYLTDNGEPALDYQERGIVWAMRGLSPGTKKVFTLTEEERVASKLTKNDVRPCVTSLRDIPKRMEVLSKENFNKYFVLKNKKCWLIKTDKKLTSALKRYVRNIPEIDKNTWTCNNQKPWYRYRVHPIPRILISSAFKKTGPRIVLNEVKAIAVGATIGIHTRSRINIQILHRKLIKYDFSSGVISREEGLKKIAVRQVNTVLNKIVSAKNEK